MNPRHSQLIASARADHRRGVSKVPLTKSVPASQEPDRATAAPGFGHTLTGAASNYRFDLTLKPNIQATLLLAARVAGETPGEYIAQAILFRAREVIGFPALADEMFRGGGP